MQGELFGVSGPVVDASKIAPPSASWLDRFRITLRLDHLAVAAILALVLYVLVFSFGVEKGKRFAIEELRAGKAKQEEISKGTTPTVPLTRESQLLPVTSRGESGAKEAATEPLQDTAPTPSGDSIASEHSASPGKYTIQIITFTSRSKAEKEVGRLKGFGHQSFVIPAGKFFQVSVGAFQNMTEAKDRLARLQSEGFASSDAFIRPLKGHIA